MKPFAALTTSPSFAFLDDLMKRFPESEVFHVGGSVRDAAMGRRLKDFDIVVRGVPAKDLERFLNLHGQTELVGERFGVYKFRPNNDSLEVPIDIALPRTEKAGGSGAYTDFDVQSDYTLPIEDDLARRDFTMNAMAWDARRKRLIDPFGGMQDIEDKRVRTVGEPRDRFREDYSRMFRGLRFAVQLGCSIEERTWQVIQKLMPVFSESIVAKEVIGREFMKGLKADALRTLELWDESGALKRLMPELAAWDKQALGRIQDEKPSMETILAVVLYPLGARAARDIIREMKLTAGGFDVSALRIMWLIDHYEILHKHEPNDLPPSKVQKLLFDRQYRREDLFAVAEAVTASPGVEAWRHVQEIKPLVSGEKIMELLGLKTGPKVGHILDHLIDMQGRGKLSNSTEAEKYLKGSRNDKTFPDPLQ